jgi:DNA-binding CsgD family transcriptional regulator/tetratricopeptide (TPR) repeat protein
MLGDTVSGHARVTVLRGEAGVGKSALLDYVSGQVEGWHVATAAGVESEMELAYSGLHQLCAPMLTRLDRLPAPQRDALATVFGLTAGQVPDRFFVAIGTLSLLADVAERRPLVCLVDDAQWLDQASAQILGFVARRLLVERIALVAAVRTGLGDDVLSGLPELPISGLDDSAARALLLDNVHGPLDATVCDRIVAESRGNPLALLELPRTWNAADLAGGFGLPGSQPVPSRIELSYVTRIRQLPPDSQLLVLIAASEPLGDAALLHRAVEALGLDMAAANPVVDAGLLKLGWRVEFTHPLVRSAAYRAAAPEDRRRVHSVLAEVTDPETDPDRRAWHRARATPGPGEEVAAELERSAGRAQARGGIAAAAAFLQRAVALTVDPARRAQRALAAAGTTLQAGDFDAALGLLAAAEAGSVDEFGRARVALVRGYIAAASDSRADAARLLLDAARRLEPFDLDLARKTYLIAWGVATVTGQRAKEDPRLEICGAIRALPPPLTPRPLDMFLDSLASLILDGLPTAASALQQVAKLLIQIPLEDVLLWGWMATFVNCAIWDHEGWHAIAVRQVQLVRDAGALAMLPAHLSSLGAAVAWTGDFAGAESLVTEAERVAAATRSHYGSYIALQLRALEGREAVASTAIASAINEAGLGRQGMGATQANWAAAVLYNGLGRYDEALAAARQATEDTLEPFISPFALPELVEAAARIGNAELAGDALERLAGTTQPSGTDFALGIEARCRAMLTDGREADELYRDAIHRLSRTRLRPELARAHLVHGEWLRRQGRRVDARERLSTAYDMFLAIGMEAFAERTRRELAATGERVRKRIVAGAPDQLTPQEQQIARLARDGLSNPEIGAQLFLSARTVEWHLRHVFTKVGITSRRQLRAALDQTSGLEATT